MKGRILAMAVATFAAIGPQTAHAADDVSLRLHWVLNGFSTAWWLGVERGYFREEGINLKINEGKGSVIAAQLVAAKSDQFGTVDAGSLIQVASKGAAIRSVMTLQATSPFGVIFLKEKPLSTIRDLEGKRVGVTAGDALTQLWPAVVAANKLDEKSIKLTFMDAQSKPIALMEKRVDAILDSVVDKRAVLENKGFHPSWMYFSDLGVRLVSITLVVHDDLVKSNPDLVKRFVRASEKTWAAFLQDPDAAVAAALKARPDADPKILADQARLSVEEIRQGFKDRQLGINFPADWTGSVATFRQLGVLASDRPAETYYSNEFLTKP